MKKALLCAVSVVAVLSLSSCGIMDLFGIHYAPKPDCHFTFDSETASTTSDKISGLQLQLVNGAAIVTSSKVGSGALRLNNPDQLDIGKREIAESISGKAGYGLGDTWTVAFWWNPSRVDYERGFTTILAGYSNGENYAEGGWVFNHMNNYGQDTTPEYSMQQWTSFDGAALSGYYYLDWVPHLPAIATWEHVAIVKDRSSLDLYINGVEQKANFTEAPTGYSAASSTKLVVGTDLCDEAATPGSIDDLVIYGSKALNALDIQALYEERIATF